jgi:superfamily II DNA helicase RecQ
MAYRHEGCPGPSAQHLAILKSTFGLDGFRPGQWRIIYNVLVAKRDQCVVMATGYGKSLCYQYPAVCAKGLTVVVSPLISLMEDQVFRLEKVRLLYI